MKRIISLLLLLAMTLTLIPSCSKENGKGESFLAGYAEKALEYESMDNYCIAGYKGGRAPEGILDPQKVKAFWLESGSVSVLIIAVDCVGLDGGTVERIRKELRAFTRESGCDSVNVISTHTHAGVDTLGLWGDIAINGKNEDFNAQIISVSRDVAEAAYKDRCEGKLYYNATPTHGLQKDSRYPYVYDENLYQLRFEPSDADKDGIRLVSFAAHAESLRGDNLMISADFPAELASIVQNTCSDRLIFLTGAIGGLIMTPEMAENKIESMKITARLLADYVLSPALETELEPNLQIARVEFETELANTLFIYYKFLGILDNDIRRTLLGKYTVSSELSLVQMGTVTLSLFPGEIFPELILDGGGLADIAKDYGIENLVPIGLANDEIGYIIPESDYVLNPDAPYVVEAEDHYEETNSVGKDCASDIKQAFIKACKELNK